MRVKILSALLFNYIFGNKFIELQSFTFSSTIRVEDKIKLSVSILYSIQPSDQIEFDNRVLTQRVKKYDKHSFETFVLALECYKKIYHPNDDVVSVPRNFTVPIFNSSTFNGGINYWPEITQGLKLGLKSQFIRTRNLFNGTEQINTLQGLGFVVDPHKNRTDLLISTLHTYRAIYGHLVIPKSFKVPHGDKRYKKEAWGLKLGYKVGNIRYRGSFSVLRQDLQKIGLETTKIGFDNRHWDHIYSALKLYKQLHGHLRIPANYIIPDNSHEWPRELYNLKLGYRCKNIRYRGDFIKGPGNEKYRRLLEEIGFEFHKANRRITRLGLNVDQS